MSEHHSISPKLKNNPVAAAAYDVMPVAEPHQIEIRNDPLQRIPIQFKLAIGSVDDPLEHEADAVADKVMRMPEQNFIQRKCSSCEKDEIQRKPIASSMTPFVQAKGANGGMASDVVTKQIYNSKGIGNSMDSGTQSFMESRFGSDFSNVKIHANNEAIQMNRELHAKAFTVGSDIYFNEGQYNPGSNDGKHLLAHELTHTIQQGQGKLNLPNHSVIQRQPTAQARLNALCYSSGTAQPNPSAREPELHPTYERWIHSFTGMAHFTANDTVVGGHAINRFEVLGTLGERFDIDPHSPEVQPAPVTGHALRGEEFIDHPTNQWVQNCLPGNLRAIAYQLPSDCADIAIILRHVWLSAHHRTETYNGWVVGDTAGAASQSRMRDVIGHVYSGNVSAMVQPYADTTGASLFDFNALAPMLHPGDILVWQHRETISRKGVIHSSKRTGGHTQTINNIVRDGSRITSIEVLQGNQPIFSDAASAILTSQGRKNTDPDSPEGLRLRDLPSRRIETSEAVSLSNFSHPVTGQQIWGRNDGINLKNKETKFTVLISAGSPKSYHRPSGGRHGRSISNWLSQIRSVNRTRIVPLMETVLIEARSIAEGGGVSGSVTLAEMSTLGQAFGARLAHLNSGHIQRLAQSAGDLNLIMDNIRNDTNNPTVTIPLINALKAAFNIGVTP